MGAYGGTKLYDTLIEAVLRVYGQSGAKCVIAFTDGLDNRSVSSPDEVIRVAQNCGIPIFIGCFSVTKPLVLLGVGKGTLVYKTSYYNRM